MSFLYSSRLFLVNVCSLIIRFIAFVLKRSKFFIFFKFFLRFNFMDSKYLTKVLSFEICDSNNSIKKLTHLDESSTSIF